MRIKKWKIIKCNKKFMKTNNNTLKLCSGRRVRINTYAFRLFLLRRPLNKDIGYCIAVFENQLIIIFGEDIHHERWTVCLGQQRGHYKHKLLSN